MAGCCQPPPSPFLALPGEPPVPWPLWITSFQTFITAAGLDDIPELRYRALLLHCLGAQGQRVLGTLGPAPTFAKAVELMKAHYPAPKGVLLRRVIFRRRRQRPWESVERFAAELGKLATMCQYGALQDEMIRDQLILHTKSDLIRQRLLLENNDLTLKAALNLAVQVERPWSLGESNDTIVVIVFVFLVLCVRVLMILREEFTLK